MLKAVTLDFWGTLANDRSSGAQARIEALGAVLPARTPAQVAEAYRLAWARFQEAGAHGWGLPPAALLSMTLDGLSATLRPPEYDHVLAVWETAHLRYPPLLLPEVPETLRALRRQGLLVALISDTGATPGSGLREYLVQQGIRALFDWLTFSKETGVTKRQPQAFLCTLAALGVRPEEAFHLGDTPASDVLGAQAAGLYAGLTIELHDRRSPDCQPDLVVERLRDLPEALKQLPA